MNIGCKKFLTRWHMVRIPRINNPSLTSSSQVIEGREFVTLVSQVQRSSSARKKFAKLLHLCLRKIESDLFSSTSKLAEAWRPPFSWFLNLFGIQFAGLPCIFQQVSVLWYGLSRRLHQGLPFCIWESAGLSGMRVPSAVFSVDGNVWKITLFLLSSLRTSANTSPIDGNVFNPRIRPQTSSNAWSSRVRKL